MPHQIGFFTNEVKQLPLIPAIPIRRFTVWLMQRYQSIDNKLDWDLVL